MQLLPAPVSKQSTHELMRQCDLVVATGSQANVRAAYASGTPAFGVGAGNVAGIVDETADVGLAADRIVRSKTFDNATSCSSENSLVIVDAVYAEMLAALEARGALLLDAAQKATLQRLMWPDGKLSPAATGQSASSIAERAGALERSGSAAHAAWTRLAERAPRILMVEETGVGPAHPFSGEKLSPVLALYRVADFAAAVATVERIYAYEGAGHSVGLHSRVAERALRARPDAAGVARDRQPGALHRHRRQLRQRPAVLAVDGLRHLGEEQLLRQHELPALPQHHAHLAADCRAGADRGRDLRQLLRQVRCRMTEAERRRPRRSVS